MQDLLAKNFSHWSKKFLTKDDFVDLDTIVTIRRAVADIEDQERDKDVDLEQSMNDGFLSDPAQLPKELTDMDYNGVYMCAYVGVYVCLDNNVCVCVCVCL